MRQATESSVGPCTHHCSLIYMTKTSKQIPAKSLKSPAVLSIKVLLCSLSKFWPGGFVRAGQSWHLGTCSRGGTRGIARHRQYTVWETFLVGNTICCWNLFEQTVTLVLQIFHKYLRLKHYLIMLFNVCLKANQCINTYTAEWSSICNLGGAQHIYIRNKNHWGAVLSWFCPTWEHKQNKKVFFPPAQMHTICL